MIKNVILVQFGLVLLVACGCYIVEAAQSPWEKIDYRLAVKVDNLNSEVNMRAASELLAHLEAGHCMTIFCRKSNMIAPLRELKKFNDLVEAEKCDGYVYKLRRYMIDFIVNRELQLKHVNCIILGISSKLANTCQSKHFERYKNVLEWEKKYERPGYLALQKVGPLFLRIQYTQISGDRNNPQFGFTHQEYIDWAKNGHLSELYTRFIVQEPKFCDQTSADLVYETINSESKMIEIDYKGILAKEKLPLIDERTMIAEDRADKLFVKVVYDQCNVIIHEMGDSFGAPQEDVEYLSNSFPEELSDDVIDYYLTWAIFRSCQRLTKHQDVELELRRLIANAANRFANDELNY